MTSILLRLLFLQLLVTLILTEGNDVRKVEYSPDLQDDEWTDRDALWRMFMSLTNIDIRNRGVGIK